MSLTSNPVPIIVHVSLTDVDNDDKVPVVEGHGGDVKITIESDVLVLNEDNFDILVSSKPIILVEFYAPWCTHCKSLEPQFAKAAEILKEHTPPIPLAKVDATVNEAIAKRYDVTGFPTLFIFRRGQPHVEYDGPRTTQGIVDYMKERADPNWKPPPESVIVLTKDNFDSIVNRQNLILVEFYAPWCGHCKQLAPEYERAARQLSQLSKPIKLAKIDATVEKELAERFGVTGYPTLFIFRRGKHLKYEGPREELGIVHYMKEQQKPPSLQIKSMNDLEKKQADDYPTVLGVFSKETEPLFELYEDAVNSIRSRPYVFLHTLTDVKGLKETAPSIVVLTGKLLKTEYEPNRKRMSIKEHTTSEDIVNFIGNNSVPLVGHRSRRTLWFYQDKYPLCVVYYDVDFSYDSRVDTDIIRQKVANVAAKFKGKITFAVSRESDFQDELKDLGLEDAGEDVNAGLFMTPKEKYSFAPDDEFESGLLEEFVEEVLDGKRDPHLKSQPVPVKNDGPVITVVGSTFEEIVTNSDKNVLLEFYAPWCGHCQRLEPVYKQLADVFSSKKHEVMIAKIDATANDFPAHFDVQGFPTIYFIPKGNKSKVHLYEGDRSLDDLTKYLNDMLKHEYSSKVEL